MGTPGEPGAGDVEALSLRWVFGFNKDIVGGVHSLTDEYRHAIFYVASNNGVIYDTVNKTQKILQGHANEITACCVSEDKRWVVTADAGPDPMLVVWDSFTGLPVKTVNRPAANGVTAMDISADGKHLVTLSRDEGRNDHRDPTGGEADTQVISIWSWMTDAEGPVVSAKVAVGDFQHSVHFALDDPNQLVSNGRKRVVFWTLDEEGLNYYSPPMSQRDFKQVVGDFTVSHLLPGTTRALSATTDGDVILWDQVVLPEVSSTDRRAVKVVKMHPGAALTYIAILDNFIVTAGADGHVRFYDFEFRVVAWFEDLDAGPIVSLSFARGLPGVDYSQATANAGTLKCPDFVVATLNALVISCSASLFDELEESGRRGTLLVQGNDAPVHGLALHPSLPRFAISGTSGTVQLWDYDERRILLMRIFDRLMGSSLAFDAKGKYLAAGFTNGALKVLNGMTLEEVTTFRVSKDIVTKIGFSHDTVYMATADLDKCVAIFKWAPKDDDESKPKEWVFLGKHNAHYRPIADLQFGVGPDGQPELVTIGQDRVLVTYDLGRSSVTGGIVLKASVKFEQVAVPTACMWHSHGGACALDHCVLVATDQFKFRLFDTASNTVRSTLLAPTHGGPLTTLALVPLEPGAPDLGMRYLAYATRGKVAGLVQLPLDGNPQKTMGAICHAGELSAMGVSWDGRWMITAGGPDLCVHMVKIQTEGLVVHDDPDGSAVDPFMALLEGGRGGAFVQEIVDYFYYAQLRSQGEDSKAPRQITGSVPLTELPNLVRALGYYPSERDVEYLVHEASYMQYEETGETVDHIQFDDFIRLYVNHRPVFGVGKEHIEQAFQALGIMGDDGTAEPGAVSREQLLYALENLGEVLSREDLEQCLRALTGKADVDALIPATMGAGEFAENILGFEDATQDDELSGEPSTMAVTTSLH